MRFDPPTKYPPTKFSTRNKYSPTKYSGQNITTAVTVAIRFSRIFGLSFKFGIGMGILNRAPLLVVINNYAIILSNIYYIYVLMTRLIILISYLAIE